MTQAAVADIDVDKDKDLPCLASESSVIGTADDDAAVVAAVAPFRILFIAGGSGVGTGCGRCE